MMNFSYVGREEKKEKEKEEVEEEEEEEEEEEKEEGEHICRRNGCGWSLLRLSFHSSSSTLSHPPLSPLPLHPHALASTLSPPRPSSSSPQLLHSKYTGGRGRWNKVFVLLLFLFLYCCYCCCCCCCCCCCQGDWINNCYVVISFFNSFFLYLFPFLSFFFFSFFLSFFLSCTH